MLRLERPRLAAVLAVLALGPFGCKKKVVAPTASMTVSPATRLLFGEVPRKGRVQRTVVFTNTGELEFDVSSPAITPEGSEFSAGIAKTTLGPGRTLEVPVWFLPGGEGERTASMAIRTSVPGRSTVTIDLAGVGVPELTCASCSAPPRDACLSGLELLVHERTGSCPDGQCQYARRVLSCAAGCDFLHTTCADVPCGSGPAVRLSPDDAAVSEVAMASYRSGYVEAWVDTHSGKRLLSWQATMQDLSLRQKDPAVLTRLPGEAWSPSLAFDGDAFALAYVGSVDLDDEVFVAIVSPDDALQKAPARVTHAVGAASQPALAFGDAARAEYGLAWVDGRADKPGVYFARVSAVDGTPLAEGAKVSDAPPGTALSDPTLAWSGNYWLVAWSDARDPGGSEIWLRRLTSAGAPVGGPLRVTTTPGASVQPQLAWTGTEFLLAWADERTGRSAVYLRHLGEDASMTGGEEAVVSTDGDVRQPRLAVGAGRSALAWVDGRATDQGGGVYAMLRAPDETTPVAQRLSTTATATTLQLAPGFGQFAVGWASPRDGRPTSDALLATVCPPAAPAPTPGP